LSESLGSQPDAVDVLLKSTEDLFVENGFEGLTIPALSDHAKIPVHTITELYPNPMDILVALLNREFSTMYSGILTNVERDPQGGLLSRCYTYIFSELYERAVPRTLFMIDRNALHEIMRHPHGQMYVPSVAVQERLIVGLQRVGMVKASVNPSLVAQEISVISGGLAITAPHPNLDEIVCDLMTIIGERYDEDVVDTKPGKQVFYQWATSLDAVVPEAPH
jgi:AcrR family transcriptional regulator